MGKKLTLIGAGSVRTVYFMESLLKFYRTMGISEAALMDTDGERLAYFGAMAKYLTQTGDADLKVTLTTDPVEALRGANVVVITIRVGRDEARARDERICLDAGVIGQETTGAGGFVYAVRSIPVVLDYMALIRRYAAEDALVFNFTNPAGLVTQAVYDAGFKNVIGICDNATGIKTDTASALGVNAGELEVKVYGLNHLSWANRVELGGRDILPVLMADSDFVERFHQFWYFDRSLVRRLGLIPNGYLFYYYHRRRALKNMLAAPESRGEFILRNDREMMTALRAFDPENQPRECLEVYREYMARREGSYMRMEMGVALTSPPPVDVSALGIGEISGKKAKAEIYEGYAGVVFNYLESMERGLDLDLAVNVPNGDAIPGMEPDDVVEVTCRVGRQGAKPVRFAPEELDPSCMVLVRTIKRFEKLTIQAIRERSLDAAVEALTVHPLVGDYDLARELVTSFQKTNGEWMGQWN